MSVLLLSALGLAIAVLMMSALWIVQRRVGNAGVVDIGWAGGIGLLFVLYALLGEAPLIFRVAIGAMGALWGFRLAAHIHQRGHGKPEDGRYAQLRRDWGDAFQAKLFGFYQLQALTVAFFALPAALISAARELTWSPLHFAGIAVWITGWIGEAIADAQLEAFKADKNRTEIVCKRGLWRYSRHPNYFFEWIVWVGIALFALPAPAGWIALLCPLAILYLLLRVTGIPATEAQAIRSKGDAYRAYQQETSAFIPWFPKKETRS